MGRVEHLSRRQPRLPHPPRPGIMQCGCGRAGTPSRTRPVRWRAARRIPCDALRCEANWAVEVIGIAVAWMARDDNGLATHRCGQVRATAVVADEEFAALQHRADVAQPVSPLTRCDSTASNPANSSASPSSAAGAHDRPAEHRASGELGDDLRIALQRPAAAAALCANADRRSIWLASARS